MAEGMLAALTAQPQPHGRLATAISSNPLAALYGWTPPKERRPLDVLPEPSTLLTERQLRAVGGSAGTGAAPDLVSGPQGYGYGLYNHGDFVGAFGT